MSEVASNDACVQVVGTDAQAAAGQRLRTAADGHAAIAGERRIQIVEATRELFETKGHSRTTITDVTEALGVTRSLFYHYFASKEDVTEAVLDSYVDDFIVLVQTWNEGREPLKVRQALHDCIRIFRIGIFDNGSFRADLATRENASLYLRFLQRSAEALARYITDTTAVDYEREHGIKIDHVYDTFYMLIIGMVGYMRRYPDASDELLEDLVAQTLRLDLDGDSVSTAPKARRASKAVVPDVT